VIFLFILVKSIFYFSSGVHFLEQPASTYQRSNLINVLYGSSTIQISNNIMIYILYLSPFILIN